MEKQYATATVSDITGLSYRQLDYWNKMEIFTASVHAEGSGTTRLYTQHDIVLLSVMKSVIDSGGTVEIGSTIANTLKNYTLNQMIELYVLYDGYAVSKADTSRKLTSMMRRKMPSCIFVNVGLCASTVRRKLEKKQKEAR